MKKFITLLCIGAMIFACKSDSKPKIDGYLISGEAPGVYNGIRVYLQIPGERGRKINKDTAIVMNEKFEFKGKVTNPEMWYLTVNSIKGNTPLVIENEYIDITVNKDDIGKSVITGGKSNSAIRSFTEETAALAENRKALYAKFKTATDDDAKASLTKEAKEISNAIAELPFQYISKNKDNAASLILLNDALKAKNADLSKIAEHFDEIDSSLRTSTLGQQINSQLVSLRRLKAAESATQIGSKAPEFSAPTPDGKQLALKDVLGKVTIVDFWAAWCGPCRRENPNVVKVYNKYHDKGLEIIGVSLDGNSRQKDPKDAWLKAIEQDKLTWNQVSNLQYFNDPVAKSYNIKSIPATFILDENGVIIAKNLRGPNLEAKIAELLD